jgi:pantoate--beta-alanine ligase
MKKLSSYDLDCIFLPDNKDIYPDRFSTSINVGVAGDILCGASRPGHFNGVATVVERLFNIVMPDRAYFGQKDFQQTVVIRNMVRERNLSIDIVVCPIIREDDGLAMSSRNVYLSSEERNSALIIYKALQHAEDIILSEGMEDADSVKTEIEKLIKSEPLAKIEYIEIVNPRDLKSLTVINEPATICIAVMIGRTRLIDNIMVGRQ